MRSDARGFKSVAWREGDAAGSTMTVPHWTLPRGALVEELLAFNDALGTAGVQEL